jgi:Siphovirus Gp157
MNETLYQLTGKLLEFQNFLEGFDATDEESLKAMQDTMESLQISTQEKFEGLMKVRANKMARLQGVIMEINRLSDMKTSIEREIVSIEKYADMELSKLAQAHPKDSKKAFKFEAGAFTLKYKKLPPVLEITDAEKIPLQYMVMPPVPQEKPDKKAILDDLKKQIDTKEIKDFEFPEWGVKVVNTNKKMEIK